MGTADAIRSLRAFFTTRVWHARLADLPRRRAVLYRASRVGYATVRGFFENELPLRAAALTYYSVLSVVPLLAFAFAVVKGFGAYQTLIQGTVRPWVRDTFAANPALYAAIDRVLRFVDQTDVSRLGTLAVVFLLYTSVTLIASVEEALNDVFGARTKRSFLRQLTDYTTLLVTAPLLVIVGTTLSAAAQSSRLMAFLRDRLELGSAIDFLMGLTPLVAVAAALFAIYVILPNVRVRVVSALLGACVAALLWDGALVLYVRSQSGMARYNALYSGLAAIPIFLVWTYASWTVVLVGAQLAASHQNEPLVRQRFRMRAVDQALRETLAVAVGAVVTRDFLAGGPRRSAAALAELLRVPAPLAEEVLEALARAGLVARAAFGPDVAWVPGGDVDAIRASDLRAALRRDPQAEETRAALAQRLGPALARLADEERPRARAEPDPTLRQLAEALGTSLGGGAPRGPQPARAGSAPATPDPRRDGGGRLDPKQAGGAGAGPRPPPGEP